MNAAGRKWNHAAATTLQILLIVNTGRAAQARRLLIRSTARRKRGTSSRSFAHCLCTVRALPNHTALGLIVRRDAHSFFNRAVLLALPDKQIGNLSRIGEHPGHNRRGK